MLIGVYDLAEKVSDNLNNYFKANWKSYFGQDGINSI